MDIIAKAEDTFAEVESLQRQRAAIDATIAERSAVGREAAIAAVKKLIAAYGLTSADIGVIATAPRKRKASKRKSAGETFVNPETGEKWEPRPGRPPAWVTKSRATSELGKPAD